MAIVKFEPTPDFKLPPEEIEMLKKLKDLDDSEIDYSDIPEFTEEEIANSRKANIKKKRA